MVVGNGLIAKAFAAFRDRQDVVVFASGVSNSLEIDPAAFRREADLLRRVRDEHPRALLVYFGTCSVEDEEQRNTPYVGHKIAMEGLLAASPGPWLVLRVPLAIGNNPGSRTLARFLHDRILSGEPFEVWGGANRFPIDVDDVFRIGSRFIADPAMWNRSINVALRAFPVTEFVRVMERILGRKALYSVVPKGKPFRLDCPEVLKVAAELELDFGDQYLERVLRKYFEK